MQAGKYVVILEKEGQSTLTAEVTLEPKTIPNADFTFGEATAEEAAA